MRFWILILRMITKLQTGYLSPMSRRLKKGSFFTEPEFWRGEIVYLKTDTEQQPHMVIAYYIDSSVKYTLTCSGQVLERAVEAFEISRDLDPELLQGLADEDKDIA